MVEIPLELLKELVDEGECWYDHNGNCQEHGYFGKGICPQKRLKGILNNEVEGE